MALGFWTDVLRSLHLRGLTETVDAVRQRWGGSRLLLGLDIVWCALRYGAGFQDYRLFAFESLTGRQRRTYLTRGSNRRLVDRQNPKSLRFLLEDKGTFDRLFLSQLGRPFLDLRVAGPEEFRSFWRAHPELVAKRPRGKCGQDVFFLPRQEPDDLYRELLERGAVLVEPRVHQHPALDGLYPGSVNTARIVTLQTGDGPRILYACLRMGNGTPVDNLDAGGLCAPLDLTTGCVTQPAGDKRGGCFPRHPVTGTQIPGFCLPDWQAAKTMVLEAAQQVPGLGYCGWDVCFLPDRPALMEGNAYPSHALVQMQVHRSADGLGLLPEIRRLLRQSSPAGPSVPPGGAPAPFSG